MLNLELAGDGLAGLGLTDGALHAAHVVRGAPVRHACETSGSAVS